MFYLLDASNYAQRRAIPFASVRVEDLDGEDDGASFPADYSARDVDVVDDALLNTAPHNVIERQLLTGDMVGLALMSGAILWSAMGAFG